MRVPYAFAFPSSAQSVCGCWEKKAFLLFLCNSGCGPDEHPRVAGLPGWGGEIPTCVLGRAGFLVHVRTGEVVDSGIL